MRRLGDIFVDLGQNAGLSPEELDSLRLRGNQLESATSIVNSWVGADTGEISKASMIAGADNVRIDSLGIRVYYGPNLTGFIQSDGDWFIGSNLLSQDTTALSILSNAQTLNGESLNAGTLLVGSNSVGKANLRWDPATGQLEFRGGVTVQAYVGTDGVIYAGGGTVKLSATGISIPADYDAYNEVNSYRFLRADGTFTGQNLFGMYASDKTDGTRISLNIENSAIVGIDTAQRVIQLNAKSNDFAELYLRAGKLGTTEASYLEIVSNMVDIHETDASGNYTHVYFYPTTGYININGSYILDYSSSGMRLGGVGAYVNEFSTDGTMAGNSDTALPTEKAVVTYVAAHGDGWQAASGTWTYASATTITVPTDATTLYSVGDKIRFKQGGAYKYFYVIAVAATLLTVTGGSDYTVATPTAITDIYYSKVASPVGFPQWFNWTGVVLSQGASTNIPTTITLSIFMMNNKQITWKFIIYSTSTGTAGSGIMLSIPVSAPSVAYDVVGYGLYDDCSSYTYNGNFSFTTPAGTATNIFLSAHSVTARGASVGTNPAVTVASGDRFDGTVIYKM
jgi:hypothetical protein